MINWSCYFFYILLDSIQKVVEKKVVDSPVVKPNVTVQSKEDKDIIKKIERGV